jgi:tetratricopeptide (TPR) repeat protein
MHSVRIAMAIIGFELALCAQNPGDSDVSRLNNLGVEAHAQGRYLEAINFLREALANAEARLASDHPAVATTLSNLAGSEIALGRLADAEEHLTRAVESTRRTLGQSDPQTAKRLSILGYLYTRKGHHAEAERLYRQALTIREVHPGNRSVDLMTTLNNLGECLLLQRRFGTALAVVRRALVLGESSWAIDHHPQLAPLLNTLASIYGTQGNWDEAQKTLQRALAIQQRALSARHPVVGSLLNNLGMLALQRRRYPEADKRFRDALEIFEEAYGTKHVEVGKALNNLAESLRFQNRYLQAEPHFRQALAICDGLLPGDHPQTIQTLFNYARLLRQTGRKTEASALEKRASQGLASRKKTDPYEHLTVDYRDLAR